MRGAISIALLACLGAGALLAWQAQPPAAAPPGPAPAPAVAASPPAAPEAPDAAAIAAALARPPFAPTRRPPIAAPVAATAASLPQAVAIAIATDRRVVLLRVPGSERLLRARAGDRIPGFLVLEVLPDRALLIDASGTLHPLLLPAPRRERAPAPPPDPASPPPEGRADAETVRLAEEIIRAASQAP
jgi:glucose/arabinose dehydrogenase